MKIRASSFGSLLVFLFAGLTSLGACSSDDGSPDGTGGTASTAGKSSGGTSSGGTSSGGSATAGDAGKPTTGGSSGSGGTSADAGGAGGESGSGGDAGASACGDYGEPCCEDRERPCLGRLTCLTNEDTGKKECSVLPGAR